MMNKLNFIVFPLLLIGCVTNSNDGLGQNPNSTSEAIELGAHSTHRNGALAAETAVNIISPDAMLLHLARVNDGTLLFSPMSLGLGLQHLASVANVPIKASLLSNALTNINVVDSNNDFMSTANLIVLDESIPMIQNPTKRKNILQLDLSSPRSVEVVNEWSEQRTRKLIPVILDEPRYGADFLLLNALHFAAQWRTAFDEKNTVRMPFFVEDGRYVDVNVMQQTTELGYFEKDNYFGVKLPFQSGDSNLSMYVFSTTQPVSKLNLLDVYEQVGWINLISAKYDYIISDLALPKMSFEQSIDFSDYFSSSPLAVIFEKQRLFPSLTHQAVKTDSIIQKVKLDVNEQGAEAAAVTVIGGSRMIRPGKSVILNQPFIAFIVNEQNPHVPVVSIVFSPQDNA